MNPFRTFLTTVGDAAKSVWKWLKRNFWWLKFILIAVGAFLGYRFVSSRIAKVMEFIRGKKTHWGRIPGQPDKLLVTDPDGGKSEIVELPAGVQSSDVVSAGKAGVGRYEVEIRHDRADRRDSTGNGDALDRLGQ